MNNSTRNSGSRASGFSYPVLRTGSASGAIAFAIFALPSAAVAQNECGIAPVGGDTVTCETDGNPYPNGVTYIAPLDDLTIVLEEGVVIDTSGNLNPGILVLGTGATDITVLGGTNTAITTDAIGGLCQSNCTLTFFGYQGDAVSLALVTGYVPGTVDFGQNSATHTFGVAAKLAHSRRSAVALTTPLMA